jgi:hypothetical protein
LKLDEGTTITDKETLFINFNEFKDALTRISCLAKFKLGGLQGISEEETKEKDNELKNYLRTRWHKAANFGINKQKGKLSKNKANNMTVDTRLNESSANLHPSGAKNLNSSLSRNNGMNSSLTKQESTGRHLNEPNSGRYHFEKPKKLTKEEKAKIEQERTINAAKSFSLKNFKINASRRDLSTDKSSAIPPIIYEDTELHIFPEIDTENMSPSTVEVLIQYLKDILNTEKTKGNLNQVKIQKAQNVAPAGGENPSQMGKR